ncbi:MAG: AMP-binding protein [Chloroflexi bacterium]|nr:AMP-binding protein [Chloroflexota bacterium]
MNYKDLLAQNANRYGDRVALIYGEQCFSFREIEAASNGSANTFLSLGVGKGSRVALLLPPGPDMVTAFFGITKIGAISVTLDPRSSGTDLDYLLQDCQPEMVITSGQTADVVRRMESFKSIKHAVVVRGEALARWLSYDTLSLRSPTIAPDVTVDDDDVDMIQYTSGTTGQPKGVMTTHGGHFAILGLIARTYGQTERDVFLIPEMPPAWMIAQLIGSWACGSPVAVVTAPGHIPLLEAVARLGASLVFAPMPIVFQMARMAEPEARAFSLKSLRLLLTGGLAPTQDIFDSIRQRFGVPLILGYACNEAGGWMALQPLDGSGKPGSSGKALADTRIMILDESGHQLGPDQAGEIVVRAPGVMKGYYNRPLATSEALRNGWLFTGDLGKMDEDGDLFVIGRKKELLKIGGKDVLPMDIEEVLATHPAVSEVAVAGAGPGLKAVVVLMAGAQATVQDVISFCEKRLPADMVPQEVEFATSLPRTLTGKVRRWALTK